MPGSDLLRSVWPDIRLEVFTLMNVNLTTEIRGSPVPKSPFSDIPL